MVAETGPDKAQSPGETPVIVIPEVRDYQRINAELIVRLDEGHPFVKLVGADGQRLLASGLRGGWNAVVEVEGNVGPEIGLGMNAPRLTVICRGHAADGAGSGMKAGMLVIEGNAGTAVGYTQSGGVIVVMGDSGPRSGLNQSGGILILLGDAGRLTGERQSGGSIFASLEKIGSHAGHARQSGRLVSLRDSGDPDLAQVLKRLDELNLRA